MGQRIQKISGKGRVFFARTKAVRGIALGQGRGGHHDLTAPFLAVPDIDPCQHADRELGKVLAEPYNRETLGIVAVMAAMTWGMGKSKKM